MLGKKISAQTGSVALGGDNNGTIQNYNIAAGATLIVGGGVETSRLLGTYLGNVISFVAQQNLGEYGHAYSRGYSNEIMEKFEFNYIALDDRLIQSYTKYSFALERAYQGAEQTNNDARVLVRLQAGSIYDAELSKICAENGVSSADRREFSRKNSHALITAVKVQLAKDFSSSQDIAVDPTLVDLSVTLLVIDAVAECAVLEKAPKHVITP